jgi:hypothetical protein
MNAAETLARLTYSSDMSHTLSIIEYWALADSSLVDIETRMNNIIEAIRRHHECDEQESNHDHQTMPTMQR